MLTRKAKYALHALTYLADRYGQNPIQISEIAAYHKIPRKFLEAILLELRHAGLLASRKGAGGGYTLIKPPQDINLAQLIRLLDGPIAMVPCVSLNYYQRCDDCVDERTCSLHKVMLEVRDETLKVLQHKTLADMARLEGKI